MLLQKKKDKAKRRCNLAAGFIVGSNPKAIDGLPLGRAFEFSHTRRFDAGSPRQGPKAAIGRQDTSATEKVR